MLIFIIFTNENYQYFSVSSVDSSIRKNIFVRAADMDPDDIMPVMEEMGEGERAYMPPFAGNIREKMVLASFITDVLHKRD